MRSSPQAVRSISGLVSHHTVRWHYFVHSSNPIRYFEMSSRKIGVLVGRFGGRWGDHPLQAALVERDTELP